ncbi:MAG: M28 family peptidase [Gammaproteobacteria bacterium]|nr:M28 family peptidase [Gammaproteobacteria bacterium]
MAAPTAVTTLLCALAGAAAAADPPTDAFDAALAGIRPEAIRADMRFLADDLLEGRRTGTRGHLLAAQFIASQFESMGLIPAGDHRSFFQDVPLQSVSVDEPASSFGWTNAAATESLKFREDYILYGDPGREDSQVTAPIVFVGYGITAPDQNYDDYKGADVKGKIVAIVFGAPDFPSAVKAHYSASWLKRKNAAAHGAAGLLLFYEPRFESLYPFAKQVRDLAVPRMNWLDAAGAPDHYYAALKAYGAVSMPAVRRLLSGSGHSAEEISAGMKSGKLAAFPLPGSAEIRTVSRRALVHSPNVVAKLEGDDPKLSAEYVVYTAHLDHLGISTPVNGDSIYNGALDNASGAAEVLEIARAFTRMPHKPRRSVLFIEVTGEEEGLLGSDYFASNPTVPPAAIVADVNIDEDLMLWPLRDVVALGAEHSSLDAVVRRAADRLRLAVSPDPQPEQVGFVRSDQYSFVRQGVPSFALTAGFKSDDPSLKPAKISQNWEAHFYHQPQDDMQQPGLNFDAAARFAQVGFLCGVYVAQDNDRPRWNQDDFFGTAFPGAKP